MGYCDMTAEDRPPVQSVRWGKWTIWASLLVAGLLALAFVTGELWRMLAWGSVALLAFLLTLAAYFWGTLLFGAVWGFLRRSRGATWSLGGVESAEHDIDPGMELLAAGVLAHYHGHTQPQVCFQNVPVQGLRVIRPFVVARTGWPREHVIEFTLTDDRERQCYRDRAWHELADSPRLVLPSAPVRFPAGDQAVGRRWSWHVRAGVTVVSAFRFVFSEEAPVWPPSAPRGRASLVTALLEQGAAPYAVDDGQTVELKEQ